MKQKTAPKMLPKTKKTRVIGTEAYYALSYQKLITYCEKKGFTVLEKHDPLDGGGSIIIEEKEITIDPKPNSEMKLYYLLHEIGHNITYKDKTNKYLYSEDVINIDSDDIDKLPYNYQKLDVLSIEIESWNNGLLLAKKLGIHVNRRKFNTCKSISLMCYLDYMWLDFFKKKISRK